MKKTIAILLVLVIGMAGVFAVAVTPTGVNLKLSTTVLPVNQMAIVSLDNNSSFDWVSLSSDFISDYASTAFSGINDAAHYKENGTTIAYMRARSNNSNGFTIKMKANPLVHDSLTQYIDYAVTVNSHTSTTSEDTSGDEVTIYSGSYSNAMIETSQAIDLELKESLYNAVDGTYTGSIVFTYEAT